jgi:hypothetical protein
MTMSGFVKAYDAPQPRTKLSGYASILYAVLLTVMAVTQLFTFENFIILFDTSGLGGALQGSTIAALIVVGEVFALPSLLRVPLSRAFRFLSMSLALLVGLVWVYITATNVFADHAISASGLFGTFDPISSSFVALLYALCLLALAIWSAIGLRPQVGTK